MKNNDWFIILLVGFVFGCVALGLLDVVFEGAVFKYKKAMAQCEKSLPRDQMCKIIAIPVEKKAE